MMNYLKALLVPLFFISSALVFMSCYQQDGSNLNADSTTVSLSSIKWHSVEDIPNLQKKSSKKIMVDVYTDWCKWCKVMDQKTFSDPAMIPFLQENYHMVKFNAEQKSPVQFNGNTFNFKKGGRRGYNELASELLAGNLSFPSVVVLDENLKVISVQKGFKDPVALKAALVGL